MLPLKLHLRLRSPKQIWETQKCDYFLVKRCQIIYRRKMFLELLMTNHLSLLRMCEYSKCHIVSDWINEYSIWLAAVSAILFFLIFELIEQFADYDNLPPPTRIIQQVLLFPASDNFLTQIIHSLITVQLWSTKIFKKYWNKILLKILLVCKS